jgi:hypothetical protein
MDFNVLRKQCIGLQLELAILAELHDDADYAATGITLRNARAFLAENAKPWKEAGQNANDFPKRIDWVLTNLEKKKALTKPVGERRFRRGPRFEEEFHKLGMEICERLELGFEVDGLLSREETKEELIRRIENGSMRPVLECAGINGKKLDIMSPSQFMRLARHAVLYDWVDLWPYFE